MASFNQADHHLVARQHIQDHSGHNEEKLYWGYPSRIVPCTNDKGTCEYLDGVYWMHTVSMLYTFILWAVIGGILLIFVLTRLFRPQSKIATSADGRPVKQSFLYRVYRTTASATRRYLLPESFPRFFPNTTRLQVVIFTALSVYLTIFSLVGIVYKTWVTPIKDSDKFNTRTGLGGFSDRIGALAYALTPLTIALSMRDSILSLLTGVPYQHFNFLHRWTGRIILVQSFIHTIGWTIIEGKLYQPQPKVYTKWIAQDYMIWGVVAQGFITFLFVFSLRPVIRWTGYEFFKKSHLIVAGLYLGACWAHWSKLACWMIASLGLLGIDLGLRILRVCLIHVGYKDGNKGIGFRCIQSKVETFKDPTGTIVRMSFTHNHEPWKIGQHYYLTFPSLSIWQSHPFTPASNPPTSLIPPTHTYIIRARNGETGKLAALASSMASETKDTTSTIPVILTGAYGGSVMDPSTSNILAIAGGTGISFVLPVVTAALNDPTSSTQNLELVWMIRHIENLAWIAPELASLKAQLSRPSSPADVNEEITSEGKTPLHSTTITSSSPLGRKLRIHIFVTRAPETRTHIHPPMTTPTLPTSPEKDLEITSSSSSSHSAPTHSQDIQPLLTPHPNFQIEYLPHSRPDVGAILTRFMDDEVVGGRTQVVASGPAELGTDVRRAVAERNDGRKVWSGDERGDLECVWDDRMG